MNTAGIVMQMFLYVEAGRFSFFQIFSFSKKLASSPKQLKSPMEYMVLGEIVSLAADGECRTPNSSPGLVASPPSLTRSQKRVRPAASTTGCNGDGFTVSHLGREQWPQCSKYRALHQMSVSLRPPLYLDAPMWWSHGVTPPPTHQNLQTNISWGTWTKCCQPQSSLA